MIDPRLVVWLSPAFPVGAFAYSHGLEWAVESGDVRDAVTVQAWLRDIVERGALRNDLILLAGASRAVAARDFAALRDVDDLALALAGSRERRLETSAQGAAFLVAMRAAWPCEALAAIIGDEHAYPVMVGAAAAAHAVPVAPALEAYALAFIANLVSAATRLGPIGQTEGQRVIATLLPAAQDAARRALHSTLDDLGGCALRSDIAAIKHETQYSRIFRS
ncbi:MAG: urease accessory protein UreF [Methylobacteriaceae bacterium]|nr:urease accessory protein UreF [Methylobacteriaceae bacterium]